MRSLKGKDDRSTCINKLDIKNYTIVQDTTTKNGSYGKVFPVRHKSGNIYAVKVIEDKSISEDSYEESVNNEINILCQCQCPTIIKVIGYSPIDFDGEKKCLIFMEYCINGSLEEYLKNNIDNENDSTIRQKFLVGIAHGMKIMHDNNCIHLDLKPANVVLDKDLNPLITDFGTARYLRGTYPVKETLGSPAYMAPEVLGRGKCGKESDVYSFGILMYEVLARKVPYQEKKFRNLQDLIKNVVDNDVRPNLNVPIKPSLKKLITRCWDSDMSQRPSFEEIFNILAYNEEGIMKEPFKFESIDDKNKYYIEGVDEESLKEYINKITESYKTSHDNTSLTYSSETNEKPGKGTYKNVSRQVLIKQNEFLQEEVNNLRSENIEVKKSVDRCRELEEKLSNLEKEINHNNEQIASLSKEIEEKNSALDEKNEHIRTLEGENALLQTVNSDSKKLNEELISKVEALNHKNQELEDTNHKNQENYHALQKLYRKNEINKKEEQIKMEQMRNKVQMLEQENESNIKNAKRPFNNSKGKPKRHLSISIKRPKEDILIENKEDYKRKFFIVINSIDAFSQKSFISKVIQDTSDEKMHQYYVNFALLLDYFLSFEALKENPKYLNIFTKEIPKTLETENDLLVDFNRIYLLADATELLYHYSAFLDENFTNIMIKFDDFVMEIKYPSFIFENIYNKMISDLENVKISILFSGQPEINEKFKYKENIISLKFDQTVQKIGDSSFSNFKKINQIEFSSSLIEIGPLSFNFCESITHLCIPSSVQKIDKHAFYHCSSLEQVFIPDSVLEIGSNCFGNCEKLQFVRLSENLKIIDKFTFRHCNSLKSIRIPASVTSIGEESFANCINLAKISFKSPTKENHRFLSIEKRAFKSCKCIENINFPNHLKFIGIECFKDCHKLRQIIFQSILNMCEQDSFSNCPLEIVKIFNENKKIFKNKRLLGYKESLQMENFIIIKEKKK